MLWLRCPFCADRPETELECGGEWLPARPREPESLTHEAWTEWLYYRRNHKGVHMELWLCKFGCGSWFLAERDTLTHRVLRTAPLGTRCDSLETLSDVPLGGVP
jgi:sarcosine oxidase subunit delta